MRKVPFHEQMTHSPGPSDRFSPAERLLREQGYLSNRQLASLLEKSAGGPLPAWLNSYLVRFFRGETKARKGRKPKSRAVQAIDIGVAIQLYDQKLEEFQKEDRLNRARVKGGRGKLPRAESSPHERAAAFVLKTMGKDLGGIDQKRLLNLISEHRTTDIDERDEIPPGERDPPDHL